MPLPVGYQCASTKNCFDYAIVANADEIYPMWRAVYVRPNGAFTFCDIEIADPETYSKIYTVKRGQILHVRGTAYYSDATTARDVIALY
ncbi:hypothetical protein UFOVP1332_21 [uncultured Caudovirales phage]|uniref:Uncharacterized protein n=1 Tax=uncultured Caudovirales phage TaxID=2100421 RepID=A0A6J5MTA8_9CAUD|nr:hypothetical protein UFOVP565_22 [uncultured Caudovirales phage]CAB4199118.1 hypothetical protein UFOVP1332_21 [uncultured Caudovirales phage]